MGCCGNHGNHRNHGTDEKHASQHQQENPKHGNHSCGMGAPWVWMVIGVGAILFILFR